MAVANPSGTFRSVISSGTDGYMYIDNLNLTTNERTRLQFSKDGTLDILTLDSKNKATWVYSSRNYSGQGITNPDWVTTGSCSYVVRNGICFLRFDITIKQITTDGTVIISGLPTPQFNTLATLKGWCDTTAYAASVEVISPGVLRCAPTSTTRYVAGYLAYPVAI